MLWNQESIRHDQFYFVVRVDTIQVDSYHSSWDDAWRRTCTLGTTEWAIIPGSIDSIKADPKTNSVALQFKLDCDVDPLLKNEEDPPQEVVEFFTQFNGHMDAVIAECKKMQESLDKMEQIFKRSENS